MRQLVAFKLDTRNPVVLKAARVVVIVAALAYLFGVALAQIALIIFGLGAVLGLILGIFQGPFALAVASGGVLLAMYQLPRCWLGRSWPTFARFVLALLRLFYRISPFAFGLASIAGFLRGDAPVLLAGLLGLIVCVICRAVVGSLGPNPYRIRHIAGTILEEEREIIRRAQEIRGRDHR